ncbi:hypothetical protein WMY93_000479 [Mugilogobius chulae]|uniref:Uncharacterized protein n=1 Tax=Mugilogobius chulae TaxID=88201 RepID=A0AAW0PZG5_9GOBI
MALEDSACPARPDTLSLPVDEKPLDEEKVEVATDASYNLTSDELGHVVTTETGSNQPPAKVKRSFQSKLAEREATANQQRKKIQPEKERGRFGWARARRRRQRLRGEERPL